MVGPITCFKAYDVRGRVPDELNEDVVYRIGRALAVFLDPGAVIVGRDIRHSSGALAQALTRGLCDGGREVCDIGLCGTEQVYFVTDRHEAAGGVMITASHNPPDYNGLKFVREDSRPISADSGLGDIRRLAESGAFPTPDRLGTRRTLDLGDAYVAHLLSYIQPDALEPLRIVVNPGNGGAGAVLDALEPRLPFELVKIHYAADGSFPNGVPNPLLPENRGTTADAVREHEAALGIAWDGDFDRCFLFDERGEFVEGYYVVGLLAAAFLRTTPGASIVHDPRLTWNTLDIVQAAGGVPVQCKAGHAFIKECMRREDAVYGGEMSAHHYFRDFAYCDSGMIPWLLVAALMSAERRPLSAMVAERIQKFPASGELNRRVADAAATLEAVHRVYAGDAVAIDRSDGLGFEFDTWRFNLRPSNTEPLIRLNVESRGDRPLMEEKTAELLALLDSLS